MQIGGRLYIRYGASRIVEARNIEDATGQGVAIPAIISALEPIRKGVPVDADNLATFFRDPPLWVRWEDDGYLNYGKCFSQWDATFGNIGYAKEAEVMREAIKQREAGRIINAGIAVK